MKKLLLALVLGLCFATPSQASEDLPIVYYDDFDLDVACGLKDPDKSTSKNHVEASNKQEASFVKATITSVSDGDTVTAQVGSQSYKVRMIGVDTPETVHPTKPVSFYGKEASDFSKAMLNGREVYLEKDVSETDRYQRALRYVWLRLPSNPSNPSFEDVRDKMFNGILLRDGYGALATFPPDVKYLDQFRKIAKSASENELGLYNKAERAKFEGEDSPKKTESDKSPKRTESNKESQGSTSPSKSKPSKGKYVGNGDIPIVNQKNAWVKGSKGSYLADITNGPIKANMSSGKYHRPGQRDYNKISVDNVTWFSSAAAAKKAGYEAAKR